MIQLTPNHDFHSEYTAYLEHMLAQCYSLHDFTQYADLACNDSDWLLEIFRVAEAFEQLTNQ